MARNKHKKAQLSPDEQSEIKKKYASGEYTYTSLAAEYKTSTTSIYRAIKDKNSKVSPQQKETENPPQTPEPIASSDALAFRQQKLAEIASDILSVRDRGSVHVLPQLHRLHIQVHDELQAIKKEIEEIDGISDPDEMLHTIAMAVQSLPPVLRDRLSGMLNPTDKVLVFKR
jgi:hypothetical protein